MNQPELLQLARVAALEAKKHAGGVLASGQDNPHVQGLAEAVAQLVNAVEALAEHLDPLTMQQRAMIEAISAQPLIELKDLPPNLGKACMEGCAGSAGKPWFERRPFTSHTDHGDGTVTARIDPMPKPTEDEVSRARGILVEIRYFGPDHYSEQDIKEALAIVKRYDSPFIGPATCADVAGLNLTDDSPTVIGFRKAAREQDATLQDAAFHALGGETRPAPDHPAWKNNQAGVSWDRTPHGLRFFDDRQTPINPESLK